MGNLFNCDCTRNSQPKELPPPPPPKITAICLLLNSVDIALGDYKGNIKIWNSEKECLLKTWAAHKELVSSIVNIKENQIASSSWDMSVSIWDTTTNELKMRIKSTTDTLFHSLYPLEETKLLIGGNKSIYFYNIQDYSQPKQQFELTKHTSWVSNFLKLNDEMLISGGYDATIFIWSLKSYDKIFSEITEDHVGNSFVSVLAKINDKTFLHGNTSSTVVVWEVNVTTDQKTTVTQKIKFTPFKNKLDNTIKPALYTVFVLNEKQMLTGGKDPKVLLWNIDDNEKAVKAIETKPKVPTRKILMVGKDKKQLVFVSEDGTIGPLNI